MQRNIAIFTGSANGFGDLIFASRLAKYLRDYFPEGRIDIFSNRDDVAKLSTLGFQAFVEKNFDPSQYEHAMVCPGLYCLDTFVSEAIKNLKITLLSEYDYDDHMNNIASRLTSEYTEIRSGFSDDAHGIFLERELLPQTSDSSYRTSQAEDFDELSNGKLKTLLDRQRQTTTIGLVYGSFLQCGHLSLNHAEYAANLQSGKNYDLVIVSTIPETYGVVFHRAEKLIEKLTPGGFTKLEIINVDKDDAEIFEIAHNQDKAEKVFRVLVKEKVQHKDMLVLHKIAGKDYTTITGDQSLSEAISKGCIFDYLLLGAFHKRQLLKNMVALAIKLGLEKVAIFLNSLNPHIAKNPAKHMKIDESLEREFLVFCQYIRNNYDLGMRIVRYIENNDLQDNNSVNNETMSENTDSVVTEFDHNNDNDSNNNNNNNATANDRNINSNNNATTNDSNFNNNNINNNNNASDAGNLYSYLIALRQRMLDEKRADSTKQKGLLFKKASLADDIHAILTILIPVKVKKFLSEDDLLKIATEIKAIADQHKGHNKIVSFFRKGKGESSRTKFYRQLSEEIEPYISRIVNNTKLSSSQGMK